MASQEGSNLSLEERWLVNRFETLLGEARAKATSAPDGTVIDCIEGVFLDQGRELLRQAVETEIQLQADLAEKKGRAIARNAARVAATRGPRNEI
jgi:hypothetical protein